MSRPAGVTATAVVQFLGSALTLLVGVLLVISALVSPSQPPGFVRVVGVMCGVIAVFAGLGAWTGLAMLRLRPWARISTLVFAGFMSVLSAIVMVTMSLVPAPPMPDAQQQVAFSAMRPFMVALYAIPLAVGIWWLVYYNRAEAKAAFAAPYVPGGPPARPLSISIIGWFSAVGGAFAIPMALTGLPAFLAGAVITGLGAKLVYLGMGAIGVYLGWSVLKLQERGRKLMIGWYALTMAHGAYVALVPGVRTTLADVQREMPFAMAAPTKFDPMSPTVTIVMMVFATALGGVVIWFLVRERARFT